MWFCAHALHFFEYEDGNQDDFLVQENVYLIQASSPAEAIEKGELQGKNVERDLEGTGHRVNDRPARLRFATVRKVVECQDIDDQIKIPTEGRVELTYSEYIVSSRDDFEKMIHGKTVAVDYIGGNDERSD